MIEEVPDTETVESPDIRRRAVRKKRHHRRRRPRWRDRLRVVFSSNVLFYLLLALVLGGATALFLLARGGDTVMR
jgi:hypothetical protein